MKLISERPARSAAKIHIHLKGKVFISITDDHAYPTVGIQPAQFISNGMIVDVTEL